LLNDPLKNLTRIKIPPSPEVYWVHDEIITFLNANKEDENYALYVTAMNTGMRISELLGLQWNKIDFLNNQIEVSYQRNRHGIINRTKNGKTVYVPMNKALRGVLSTLKQEERSLDYVFMKKNGEMINPEHFSERVFKKAITKAGVKVICFRNLRTSFAANYCMNGGDLYAVSKILNHASAEFTAKKYAHLHPSFLKKAIETVSFEADSPHLAHGQLKLIESN
jgi:integrase/recombinase XerD